MTSSGAPATFTNTEAKKTRRCYNVAGTIHISKKEDLRHLPILDLVAIWLFICCKRIVGECEVMGENMQELLMEEATKKFGSGWRFGRFVLFALAEGNSFLFIPQVQLQPDCPVTMDHSQVPTLDSLNNQIAHIHDHQGNTDIGAILATQANDLNHILTDEQLHQVCSYMKELEDKGINVRNKLVQDYILQRLQIKVDGSFVSHLKQLSASILANNLSSGAQDNGQTPNAGPGKKALTRTAMTDAQKYEVCIYMAEHEQKAGRVPNRVFVAHVLHKYNIKVDVSTISRLRQQATVRMSTGVLPNPSAKRHRPVMFPELERRLAEYVGECKVNNIALTDTMVLSCAREFAHEMQIPKEQLGFSDGWLQKFKIRHGVVVVPNQADNKRGPSTNAFNGSNDSGMDIDDLAVPHLDYDNGSRSIYAQENFGQDATPVTTAIPSEVAPPEAETRSGGSTAAPKVSKTGRRSTRSKPSSTTSTTTTLTAPSRKSSRRPRPRGSTSPATDLANAPLQDMDTANGMGGNMDEDRSFGDRDSSVISMATIPPRGSITIEPGLMTRDYSSKLQTQFRHSANLTDNHHAISSLNVALAPPTIQLPRVQLGVAPSPVTAGSHNAAPGHMVATSPVSANLTTSNSHLQMPLDQALGSVLPSSSTALSRSMGNHAVFNPSGQNLAPTSISFVHKTMTIGFAEATQHINALLCFMQEQNFDKAQINNLRSIYLTLSEKQHEFQQRTRKQ